MTKLLLLPGRFGSDAGHWQRFWMKDVVGSEFVEQYNWDFAEERRWIENVEHALEVAGEAYIVAHSLGCILSAKLAESPSARRIRGALLVTPCDLGETAKLHKDTPALPVSGLSLLCPAFYRFRALVGSELLMAQLSSYLAIRLSV